ncbi:hypothetical protein MMC11_006257 [Xylographa trunciseda]|nr:hypothetical protein [Xylographa trunciseda]
MTTAPSPSTMGSARKFAEMVRFVAEKGIRPVVQRVAGPMRDLEAVEALVEDLEAGRQFGKLVVRIQGEGEGRKGLSRL